jgi:transcriptional regulator with XRE-family HTH domain
MPFGDVLVVARKSRGISQHRLALAVQTTQRHMSFLETGRSRPTREMILRIGDALELQPGRRADLFEAAGFISPYKRRAIDDAAIADAVRGIERYVLQPWPYPALALTETWDVLAANQRAMALFGIGASRDGGAPSNLFDVMLYASFRETVANWREVSGVVLARLRRHAAAFPDFRRRLDAAIAAGAFEEALAPLAEGPEIPVILPLAFAFPDGRSFRMTTMTAPDIGTRRLRQRARNRIVRAARR